jgi:dCMP deaminase
MRPSRDEVYMEVAQRIARRGTCDRKQVGAVVTRAGRCVCWGYNGAPPGLPHCEENIHGWKGQGPSVAAGIIPSLGWYDEMLSHHGCRNATHAEANALAFAARQGISTESCTLYVTVAPCDVCARLLIAAGIVRVCYNETYRDASGLRLLEEAGLEIVQCQQEVVVSSDGHTQ